MTHNKSEIEAILKDRLPDGTLVEFGDGQYRIWQDPDAGPTVIVWDNEICARRADLSVYLPCSPDTDYAREVDRAIAAIDFMTSWPDTHAGPDVEQVIARLRAELVRQGRGYAGQIEAEARRDFAREVLSLLGVEVDADEGGEE